MPENDDQETTSELRTKLEKALADLASANTMIAQQRETSAFQGVKVSDRQRKVILRELAEEKKDITTENVTEVGKELGFISDQAPTPTPPTPTPNGDGTPPSPPPDTQGNGDEQDQNIMVSLDEISVIDRANFHARRGNISQDLETKMRNAKSPEELTTILRSEGAKSGLVHEWDTE